jgi:DNA-binding transcriptional LysR family regulator
MCLAGIDGSRNLHHRVAELSIFPLVGTTSDVLTSAFRGPTPGNTPLGDHRVMELRRLRYFVAVAEELHFRRAADRLHLAQPALSQQVRKLEVEIGVDLFHRSRRGVTLTPAGSVFLDEARRLLRHADEAARTARNARTGKAGRVRVGHLADAVPPTLLRGIAAFAARNPGVEIVPETIAARSGVEDVRSGRLDVAIISLPAPVEGLKVTPFATEGTVAAVPDRHLLSGRASIPLDALAETPLILLPRPTNPAFYDAVLGACRAAGISPQLIDVSEPQVEHALLLVASGIGVALLPASAADRYSTVGVSFRPLDAPSPTTELALVSRADAIEVPIAAFLRIVTDLVSEGRRTASVLEALEPPPLPLSA